MLSLLAYMPRNRCLDLKSRPAARFYLALVKTSVTRALCTWDILTEI